MSALQFLKQQEWTQGSVFGCGGLAEPLLFSTMRVEVISAKLSEPHIPVPYWSGKENWAGISAQGKSVELC